MSVRKEMIRFIKEQLAKNSSKDAIAKQLAAKYPAQTKEYLAILKDFPEPALKQKYRTLNRILLTCIVALTLLKLLDLVALSMELGAVASPLIIVVGLFLNVLLIGYLRSCRASAYIFSAGLLLASLARGLQDIEPVFTSGDSLLIGGSVVALTLVVSSIVLSIVVLRKIHPGYTLF